MNLSDPVDMLARTLWGEARSEGRAGLEAVASVILNRAAHPRWWGSDVITVITKPWQFSCWLPEPTGQRSRLLAVTVADPYFKLALAVAQQAISGGLLDATHGADSYANLHVCSPAWARGLKPCAVIGAHTFFRLELHAPAAPVFETDADRLNDAQLNRH